MQDSLQIFFCLPACLRLLSLILSDVTLIVFQLLDFVIFLYILASFKTFGLTLAVHCYCNILLQDIYMASSNCLTWCDVCRQKPKKRNMLYGCELWTIRREANKITWHLRVCCQCMLFYLRMPKITLTVKICKQIFTRLTDHKQKDIAVIFGHC